MTHTDLKKLLKSYGIGGFFGRGIRLFDEEYFLPSRNEISRLVTLSLENLAYEGLAPEEDYAKNGSDCDSWVLWIQSEVMKAWATENAGKTSYPSIAFGRALVPGHAVNIAVTPDGALIFNYGQLTDWNLKEITEVEFV